MKYQGSKNRIAKHILPIMLKYRTQGQYWVEPFVGGANMIDKVTGNRIGADFNQYIANMWKSISSGWTPKRIAKEEYIHIKNNSGEYDDDFIGWVGIACSYSGKWFGGFAGEVKTKQGIRDYQKEAFINLEKQRPSILGVEFKHASYDELNIPPKSIIYCDPPYEGTTGYKDKFNHDDFWQWCREKSKEGHTVFVSEYSAPDDFKCIWQKEVKSSLSANGKSGGSKNSIEKLFTI